MELTGVSIRRHSIILLQLLLLASQASAKAVFAHFMVSCLISPSILLLIGVHAYIDGKFSAV